MIDSLMEPYILSIERNPFSAQNQTLRSFRGYTSPAK